MFLARQHVNETALRSRVLTSRAPGDREENGHVCLQQAGRVGGCGFGRPKLLLLIFVKKSCLWDLKRGEVGGIQVLAVSINCERSLRI